MATVKLAANYIEATAPSPIIPDRIENSGHLQFVFSNNGTLMESEVQSFFLGFGDWQYPAHGRSHAAYTDGINPGGVIPDAGRYRSVELQLREGQSAENLWELLGQIHASFSENGSDINYDETQNSNSYVNTVLSVIGIPLTPGLLASVTPEDIERFPGSNIDVLQTGALTFAGLNIRTPIVLEVAGTAGNDFINSGIADDVLGGMDGEDVINAGDGDDTVNGGEGDDTVNGGEGNDTLDGGGGNDIINGGDDNDRIFGGANVDRIWGDDGNDLIEGGSGRDILRGGADNDLIFASQYFEDISEELSSSSRLFGNAGDDILIADAGGNMLLGGGGRDILLGGAGNDTLEGGGGQDFIIARGGQDIIRGGTGNDWIHALDPDADAFIFFDRDSGRDFIQQDSEGGLGGVSEITFEGISTGDVQLIWDFDVLSSQNFDDYEEEDGEEIPFNFNNLFQELGGDAVVVVKTTGASINLGYLEGTRSFRDEVFATTESELSSVRVYGPRNTNLVFSDDESGTEFSQLVSWGPTNPTTGEVPDGGFNRGLFDLQNLSSGSVNAYDNAPNQFLNNFSNEFAADLTGLRDSDSTIEVASLLSQETIDVLTDDVFGFA